MNRLIPLLVVLLIIVVDVWSVYRSDWLLLVMNTAIGVTLLIKLRKPKAAPRLQVVLLSMACVIGVIRLAIMLFK
jgi:hypothetical protein